MKIIKYIGAGICLLLAIAQVMPIYLIVVGLIQEQDGVNTAYFMGKLVGHLFVMILFLFVASKLIKGARN